MSDQLHCDDGCTMSPQEALAAMKIADEDEEGITAAEFQAKLQQLLKEKETDVNAAPSQEQINFSVVLRAD